MISVVIPTHNNGQVLRSHVERYEDQSLHKDMFEVIVVRDGGDLLPDLSDLDYVRVVDFDKNRGPAYARNHGAMVSLFDRVLFVGDDCFPQQDLLLHHAIHDHLFPHVALQGYSPFHPDVMDTRFMHWLDKSGMQASWQNLRNEKGWRRNADGYLLTTNWSINRQDFLELGGFPEDFPSAAWEDVCLGHVLRRSGYKNVFDPAAINFHYHKHNIQSFVNRSKREGRSRVTLATLYPEFASTLLAPEDLRGALTASLPEYIAQARKLQYVSQANIADLLKTVMVGAALQSAWEVMESQDTIFNALPHVHNAEFPAYIFSCKKAIDEKNDGFAVHCIAWAVQKEPSNWATYGFAGEVYLALGNISEALTNFKTAVEMSGGKNEWVLRKKNEIEQSLDSKRDS